jgi:adenine-specific DNA glycosylase
VLDGNVLRVLARLGAVRGDLRPSLRWQELQNCADAYLDTKSPGDWNQAIMELGATLCAPKSPQCLVCPVEQFCEGRKQGIADLLPEKRKKRATVEIRLAAAVFADERGRTLLLPPPEERNTERIVDYVPTLASNLWHFPTVSVNGDPVAKLRRYLRKLQSQSQSGNLQFHATDKVRHTVTYRSIIVEPFCVCVRKLPRIKGAGRVPLREITALPVSNLTRKVARAALAAACEEKNR